MLQLISAVSEHSMLRAWEIKFIVWKMWFITFQFMGRTNHKFPVCVTRNVKTHLQKSTVFTLEAWWQYYSSCHVRANLDTLEPKCVELEWHLKTPALLGQTIVMSHTKWINSGAGAPILASVR